MQGGKPPNQQLITVTILKIIKNQLAMAASLTLPSKCLIWAACTQVFFGFLHASEFCAPSRSSFDLAIHLCLTDINFSLEYRAMRVRIKASKTDQARKSMTLQIGAANSSVCPVTAMGKFLHYRGASQRAQPLFMFNDGTFQNHFSSLIGVATTAATVGLPDWLIQVLGHWSSDVYRTYICQSKQPILQAASIMANEQSQ